MSKYVVETGESWRKFLKYIFLKVDMVHPLDARMFHIPSCICRRIQRFPSYCRIYDITRYLTPPQLRKPAPCTDVGWRTPRGTLAHSFKYIKMVCKQSINSTQGTEQTSHICSIYNTEHHQCIFLATIRYTQLTGPISPRTYYFQMSPGSR